jgi:hypothetical protein
MASYVTLNGAPPSITNPWNISGTVSLGDVVYQVSGADRTVARADADNAGARPPLGVVCGIAGSTVLVAGNGDLASGLSGLTTGTVYWLSTTAGQLVDTKPASNAYLVGVATSPTELLVGFTAADLTAGAGGGSGTVTSVGVASADSSLAVSGSPITSSGSVTVDLATVAVADGGTGLTSTSEGALLLASSSGAYVSQTAFPFMRNRLINGAHMVSQRYVDRPVAPAATVYPTDRWVASSTLSSGSFLAGRSAGWSNSFDGSGDYLSVTDNAALELGTADFTLEMWVNTTTASRVITSKGSNTNVNFGNLNIGLDASGVVGFSCNPNAGDAVGRVTLTGTTSVTTGVWVHIAVSRSSTSWRLFINGTQEASATSSVGFRDSADPLYVGCTLISSVPGSFFDGYISNLRIVKGTALYTSAFTPQTSPLIPVANTSLLTCASEVFQDKSSNNFTVTPTGNVAVSSYSPFTVAPAGFTAGLQWSVLTPASASAAETALISQRVEAASVSDLAWGTASAKAVTLSFWVRSSVAGTYCAGLRNNSFSHTYIAEYTISSADTWEKKTIQVPGPTVGTWPGTTGAGIRLDFDLGSGTNFNTTADAWQAGNFRRTANQTNFIGTGLASGVQSNNFLITGVQFESGNATPFEFRPMQAELALCQRYYARLGSLSGNFVGFGSGAAGSTTSGSLFLVFPQPMITAPAITQSNTCLYDTAARAVTAVASVTASRLSAQVTLTSSGLTLSRAVVWCGNNNPNAYVELNSEI